MDPSLEDTNRKRLTWWRVDLWEVEMCLIKACLTHCRDKSIPTLTSVIEKSIRLPHLTAFFRLSTFIIFVSKKLAKACT